MPEKAKAEALAYLEARARATAKTDNDKYGDSGFARMTSKNRQRQRPMRGFFATLRMTIFCSE
jgi:hypothetical protein